MYALTCGYPNCCMLWSFRFVPHILYCEIVLPIHVLLSPLLEEKHCTVFGQRPVSVLPFALLSVPQQMMRLMYFNVFMVCPSYMWSNMWYVKWKETKEWLHFFPLPPPQLEWVLPRQLLSQFSSHKTTDNSTKVCERNHLSLGGQRCQFLQCEIHILSLDSLQP